MCQEYGLLEQCSENADSKTFTCIYYSKVREKVSTGKDLKFSKIFLNLFGGFLESECYLRRRFYILGGE